MPSRHDPRDRRNRPGHGRDARAHGARHRSTRSARRREGAGCEAAPRRRATRARSPLARAGRGSGARCDRRRERCRRKSRGRHGGRPKAAASATKNAAQGAMEKLHSSDDAESDTLTVEPPKPGLGERLFDAFGAMVARGLDGVVEDMRHASRDWGARMASSSAQLSEWQLPSQSCRRLRLTTRTKCRCRARCSHRKSRRAPTPSRRWARLTSARARRRASPGISAGTSRLSARSRPGSTAGSGCWRSSPGGTSPPDRTSSAVLCASRSDRPRYRRP